MGDSLLDLTTAADALRLLCAAIALGFVTTIYRTFKETK
jgi:hypothetical protein